MRTFNTNSVYVAWDKKLTYPSSNFRKTLSTGQYKSNRPQENKEDLYNQIKIIEDILPSLGIKNVYPNIMEGDDVIAYLADTLPGNNIIISVDQDLVQLISPSTFFYNLNKKKLIDLKNFEEEIGVKFESFVLYKSIMGDNSDNISGLFRYGKVKSKKLAENWETDKSILSAEQLAIIETNRQMVDLRYGYKYYPDEVKSYTEQLSKLTDIKPDLDRFKEYCQKYEFKSHQTQLNEWSNLLKQSTNLADLFTK